MGFGTEAFGPRRPLWDADFTQLARTTYADCLQLRQDGLPFLSANAEAWILGRTDSALHVSAVRQSSLT